MEYVNKFCIFTNTLQLLVVFDTAKSKCGKRVPYAVRRRV